MDFGFLYDSRRKVLSVGCDTTSGRLERSPSATVRVGQALGDVDSLYIFERKDRRLKPARIPAFRAALKVS